MKDNVIGKMVAPLKRTAWQKTVAGVLVLCMAASPLIGQEESEQPPEEDTYESGYIAGKRDAKGDATWICSGLYLGPIGVVLPWVVSPKVPGGNLIGKSAEYVEGYTKAYRKKVKKVNFGFSLIGFGIFAGSVLGLAYAWKNEVQCSGLESLGSDPSNDCLPSPLHAGWASGRSKNFGFRGRTGSLYPAGSS